jgi:hypothetical protein
VVEEETPEPLNIIDGFIAFLLAVLIESGLIEVSYQSSDALSHTLTVIGPGHYDRG